MKQKIHISPWMPIGISLVLITVVGFLGVVNYNRDKERMGMFLKEKGAALIRSFEAGARTGMMGKIPGPVNERHLQILLEETADQPDITYISIIDRAGIVLAHNNRSLIGRPFMDPDLLRRLAPSDTPLWRIVEQGRGEKNFEVYKVFLPVFVSPGHLDGNLGRSLPAGKMPAPESRPYIFIGMNIAPFKTAMEADFKHNLVMAAIIFSLGLAGVISLFWAQNYTRSIKLLADTRKLASAIVTHLPVGILVMNADHRVIYSNQMAWDLLGADGAGGRELDARKFLPETMWELQDKVNSGHPAPEKEICLFPEENKPVPAAVSATDVHGENGEYIGFLFVIKDLTEIRELEAKNQRIEKLATIGNMAAGIAHEIRNPLSSIKGYVTYFGSLFKGESENRKAANLMAEEVDRVNRVITELLEFARPSDLKRRPVNIDQVIDHSLRVVAHDAQTGGVQIIREGQTDTLIHADPDRLAQVLLNLFINAFQAMPDGGTLWVRTGMKKEDLLIQVEDTGYGIGSGQLPHIFDPYFTTKNKGTGLGLAIAHKIIENHNGFIKAQSRENEGTTISIVLPLTKERSQ